MRSRRATAAIPVVLAMAAMLPGSVAAQDEPIEIAFFAPLANSYVAATIEGIEAVTEPAGANVTLFDTGFDATLQFSQVQDAVTQERFDALIIIPLDAVGLVPAVEEAIAAGLVVVTTDLALGPDLTTSAPQVEGQAGAVLTPGTERAENSGAVLLAACADLDPCRVGWIAGVATIDFEIKVREKLEQIVAENPHIELVVYQDGGGYLAEPANQIAQDILLANPDLDVLATSGDQMTLGAELAVIDAGLTPGEDIRLIGGGGSCPAVEKVRSGAWFGTTLDVPYNEGLYGAQIALDWVTGASTEPVGLNAQKESGYPLVLMADTIGDFECQWEG